MEHINMMINLLITISSKKKNVRIINQSRIQLRLCSVVSSVFYNCK